MRLPRNMHYRPKFHHSLPRDWRHADEPEATYEPWVDPNPRLTALLEKFGPWPTEQQQAQ